jgi:general secretion pathway protein I
MRDDRGFTLIEVLVALAIVGLALAAVSGVFSNGLVAHETAAGAEDALALAEERLAIAAAPGGLRPGISKGVFAGFAWQAAVEPYDDGAGDAKAPQRLLDTKKDRPRLYRIAVSVAWRDGHRERQLALSTLRLGTPPP